jgi:hypothetical protein
MPGATQKLCKARLVDKLAVRYLATVRIAALADCAFRLDVQWGARWAGCRANPSCVRRAPGTRRGATRRMLV